MAAATPPTTTFEPEPPPTSAAAAEGAAIGAGAAIVGTGKAAELAGGAQLEFTLVEPVQVRAIQGHGGP